MKILYIGDIMGEPGRRAVGRMVPRVVSQRQVDVVIGNGEDVAGGFGITPELAEELFEMGLSVITTGNHVWADRYDGDLTDVFALQDEITAKVVAAIEAQLKRFTHTCYQVVPYELYIELAEKLNAMTPGSHAKKTAFYTTGAEAVARVGKVAVLWRPEEEKSEVKSEK